MNCTSLRRAAPLLGAAVALMALLAGPASAVDFNAPHVRYGGFSYHTNHYVSLNPDVAARCGGYWNYDTRCVDRHFDEHGVREGRQASTEMDPVVYRRVNPDLAGLSNVQLHEHWRAHGYREDRVASLTDSPIFGSGYYRTTYTDLQGACAASYAGCEAHFKFNGLNEGRQGSHSFNVNAYRQYNPDVVGSNRDLAIHYLAHGRREGRRATY